MNEYFYIIFWIVIFIILFLFFRYLSYKNLNIKYRDHFFYLKNNLKILESEIFYREVELFIKKVISIRFKKSEIYYLNTDFVVKTYNWKLIEILKEILKITSDIDKIHSKKIKKQILKKLLKELKK